MINWSGMIILMMDWSGMIILMINWSGVISQGKQLVYPSCPYAIRSAKRFLSIDNLTSLCFSLFHSHLAYWNILYGTAYLHRLHGLIMIQKKCVRNVCNVLHNAETSCLFKQLAILKFTDIMPIQLCKFMHAYTNGHCLRHREICLRWIPIYMNITLTISWTHM